MNSSFKLLEKTSDLLGCPHRFLRKCITYQFCGNMTFEKYGSVRPIDHRIPISSFNLLNESEMRKFFQMGKLRPM